jgi:hypothetical protein
MKAAGIILAFVLLGCLARPIVEKADDRTHSEQNTAIAQKIREIQLIAFLPPAKMVDAGRAIRFALDI